MNRYLLIAIAACAVAILFGWQHIRAQGVALDAATARNTTLEAAAESRRNTQRLLADLDTEHTKALTDAQAQNSALRARVGTGNQRLSVAATCPAVRATTGTASVDHAETRADIDPAAAERIVAISNDGDDAIRALSALQDYVSRVCLGGSTQKGR
ncbi:lysis system i-spanin subunit Rz [Pseudomonas sp. GL-R-26]|uniref:lysis system i-spanin subunit Rz n=1 Tax=Pseudomonas sp. GL-R-26 TaxID=2832392 RepID=UPI001CBB5C5D|nr:lysis system i-spanin subunit Rz [Pseudomonas sp. GL-R-26]